MTRQNRWNSTINRRNFLQSVGATAGFLALQGCAGAASPGASPAGDMAPGEPRHGGTIRIAYSGPPGRLDPALVVGSEENLTNFAVYEGLARLPGTLTPEPVLAQSWQASDDLTTWTFQLREGVRFHHGTQFTATDVVYTFERVLDPALGSPARTNVPYIESVEEVDTHTVRFHLSSPNAEFPSVMCTYHFHIVPHDRTEQQIAEEALGTGPFRLVEYAPGDRIRFERNEDYWDEGLPYLDGLQQVHIPEQVTQLSALSAGSIDVMHNLGFENLATVEADPNLKVSQTPSGLYVPLVMRVSEEPFTDIRVRQALKLCVDRPGTLQLVTQGRGELGNDQPVPPVSPFWADIPIPEQNHERARELLAEAGYPDGLDLTLYTSPIRSNMVQTAVAFQEMAKPAGIRIEIQRTPTDVYWSEYWLKVPFCVSSWGLRPTADETLSIAYHSAAPWNESDFQNPELDRLIEEARGEPNEERRAELYAQAQQLLHDEGGSIISFYLPFMSATRAVVQNFEPDPMTSVNFRDTWLSAA